MQKIITVNNLNISNDLPFTLIAGPCAMEDRNHSINMASELKKITSQLGINFIFKASFDKANRTSITSSRGAGLEAALQIFEEIKKKLNIPVTTDVHEEWQCKKIAKTVDILQIPAFLAKETDLIISALETGNIVNIKKGQFMLPHELIFIKNLAKEIGNEKLMFTERGTSLGEGNLVVNLFNLGAMKESGDPVVFDATHSVQSPGGLGDKSGGDRSLVPLLAKSAMSSGIGAVFIETHQDPDNAPCDGPNMVPLHQMYDLLKYLQKYDSLYKKSQKQNSIKNQHVIENKLLSNNGYCNE